MNRLNAQLRLKHRRRRVPTWIWIAVVGLAFVMWLVLAWLLYSTTTTHGAGRNNAIDGLTLFSNTRREHLEEDVIYDQNIPVGGPHSSVWLNCGIYDEPVEEDNIVHSLEHGAIWLAYRPDLPVNQVEFLRDLVRQEHRRFGKPFLILAPKPGLDVSVVATAWQMQLELDDVSDNRLIQFLRRYHNGLFTPEPDGNCMGGIGQPDN